jgi:hypothetical protein
MSTPIYLGRDLTINGSNINFKNANVSVKTPIENSNVVNKGYIDEIYSEITNIIETNISNTVTQAAELQSNINNLQSDINDLSDQLNNMYQYFLKQDRTVSIPRRI